MTLCKEARDKLDSTMLEGPGGGLKDCGAGGLLLSRKLMEASSR